MMDFGGTPAFGLQATVMRMPGQLPDMRPTHQEVRLMRVFPDDSPILHEWIGTEGGRIVIDEPPQDSEHVKDPAFYQGRVVEPDGTAIKHFEFRAEPAGRVSRATATALGWLMNESVAPRGWLSGRAYRPSQAE